ncbi:adenine phosphoribosyltransferase [Roseovarius sp. SCSIO 43702]|uniref:adenine phosphoribosyltransferase n=1 Tax=Roseovarius sp. SCSIO 43702 TaxID=2823043 RepID=UPI001C7378B9|nr:adenine phosphoribosyltransferase [Roseovarius sp. SCSIO 43702]QYX57843.1 adenine phosphoribosyltransferase [Roseovarius sp. SCSIO 43702]
MSDIKLLIRTIPDFPRPGIMFRDVTTLFADADGLRRTIDAMTDAARPLSIDAVAGLEARGFILGGALADRLGAGFVTARKAGKLPGATISEPYTLEYGEAALELHDDAIEPGARVLVVDDLLATGGTAAAAVRLIERLGGEVAACSFVIDLLDLGGRARLERMGLRVDALCAFAGD